MKHLIILLLFFSLLKADLKFIGENLNFQLSSNRFRVSGNYFFYNNSNANVKTLLFYPFVVDSNLYEEADSVYVFNQKTGQRENLKHTDKGIYFTIECPPKNTVKYLIGYSQNLKGKQAEYILKTTKYWNSPLLFADYSLISGLNLTIELPYQPDTIIEVDNKKIYTWNKQNFSPQKNMLFKFK